MAKGTELVSFRPRARLLLLLGEQLIRDAGLAVFELVKNAYDADARNSGVTMYHLTEPGKAKIVVEDDGVGMTPEIIREAWLVIGTNYRAQQRLDGTRTPVFRRMPLGEKGVGRLAIHKLGHRIKLVSRAKGAREVVLDVDWDDFDNAAELADVKMNLKTRDPEVFTGKSHGTRIEVEALRETWTKAKVRDLHRSVTSLCSPFAAPDSFKVSLKLVPSGDWLDGLLDADTVLEAAMYRAHGWFEGSNLHLEYDFRPLPGMEMEGRPVRGADMTLASKVGGRKVEILDLSKFKIGRVNFDFYLFDREPAVLKFANADKKGLKTYLDENGGIRIYRDGVRVFDFGEPGNDWLNLDVRRVNRPTIRTSNNQILGALQLNTEKSTALVEKTNREGFIDSEAYQKFSDAVVWVLTQVEAERQTDQRRVRALYSRGGAKKRPVIEELSELREHLAAKGWLPEVEQHIDRIEKQFNEVQEVMLQAAAPGLTFGSVVHQAEKVVKELVEAVDDGKDLARIRELVGYLSKMMDGLTFLISKSGFTNEKASVLIRQALFNCELRLKKHEFRVINGLDQNCLDFTIKCVRRLVVATLMNLIDNSLYWVETMRTTGRQLYIGTTMDLDDRPAIVVADNGPGFRDERETLIEPFFSRRPDGMGLGLHLADEIASKHNGKLLFPQRGDISLPRQFTGAIVALQFPKEV